MPLRSKKAGRFKKLLGFARSHSIATLAYCLQNFTVYNDFRISLSKIFQMTRKKIRCYQKIFLGRCWNQKGLSVHIRIFGK